MAWLSFFGPAEQACARSACFAPAHKKARSDLARARCVLLDDVQDIQDSVTWVKLRSSFMTDILA
jgi:hypothetical protein